MMRQEYPPRIRCARCDKLVDRVWIETNVNADTRTLSVECHGERDHMTFTRRDLVTIDNLAEQIAQQEGVAFIDLKRISK